jgi:putative two-component system response regulator
MKEISGSRILIVDDTKSNIDVLVAGLKPNYRLSIALNGEAALKSAESKPPDLILLDVMMPEMDGYEVCRRLKANPATREIPVLFLSALDQATDKVKGFRAGGADFVSKPFEMLEVRARVEALLKAKAYSEALAEYRRRLESAVAQQTSAAREAGEQLGRSAIETALRLAMAAALTKGEPTASIVRLSRGAELLARRLRLDEVLFRSVVYAVPVRDVGMIAISNAIPRKPGRLDEAERPDLHLHPIHGAALLERSRSPILRAAREIALTHHERRDGSGYPNGLRGTAIPVSGRIAAVVDVYEALTSPRPYRDAFSHDEAVAHFRDSKGLFDTEVVEAFLKTADQFAAFREQTPDTDDEAVFRHFGDVLEPTEARGGH